MTPRAKLGCCLSFLLLAAVGCGKDDAAAGDAGAAEGSAGSIAFIPNFDELPAAGNPDGHCAILADAQPEDSSTPDHVIGTGTKESCTGEAFVDAVAQGGVITFDCGPDPVTITLTKTAKVFNDKAPKIVIDGGGKVALSGGAIFYVSNSGDGDFVVKDSIMRENPTLGFDSAEVPGSFVKTNQPLQIFGSTITK